MPSGSRANSPDSRPAGRELELEAEIDILQEAFASALSSLKASFFSAVSQISDLVTAPEHNHRHDSVLEAESWPARRPNIPRPLIPPPITGKAYVPEWNTTRINTASERRKVPAAVGRAKRGQGSRTTTKTVPTKRERREGEDEDVDESCVTLERFGRRCGMSPPQASHQPRAEEVVERCGEWALEELSVFDGSGDEEVHGAAVATDRVVSRLRREARESLLVRSDEEDMSW